FSARKRAPLGTGVNVCTEAGVSMRAGERWGFSWMHLPIFAGSLSRRHDPPSDAMGFGLCEDPTPNREAIKLDARFRGHERGAVAGMSGGSAKPHAHVFGSFVTATFTVPLASAITRRVFASNAMPER